MSSSKNVVELTDDNFEAEILQSDVPALVDFWAEWCMPCKMLGPVIDQLADDFAGRAKIAKLDTDNAQETARRFGITAIPTLMLFKDGQVVKKFVGLQQKADLKEAIEETF
ncbi:MAG: thioredoxin [Planctomycetaceae bacterium]|nr:thioredoxin [Planctomycetaceae bacterium]